MDLLRRIGIFSIGLSAGLIILAFFFKGKGVELCYFPNCRVLKDIRSKAVFVDKQVQEQGFSIEEIKPLLWNGNVDFSQSDTKTFDCKTYTIVGKSLNNKDLQIVVKNCQSQATIISAKSFEKTN